MDSGQSTRMAAPELSGGSCWLPRRGRSTSLFLSEKCNHFLTWALGERKAARRPPCPCLPVCLRAKASPPWPHVDKPPVPGCSRQLPRSGGMQATRPGYAKGRMQPGELKGRIVPILSLRQREGCSPPGLRRVSEGDGCGPEVLLARSRG